MNVHPPKRVMCHMSCVTCHVSHVTCPVSHVTFFSLFFGQSGGAYRWRDCYQRGLPRLVSPLLLLLQGLTKSASTPTQSIPWRTYPERAGALPPPSALAQYCTALHWTAQFQQDNVVFFTLKNVYGTFFRREKCQIL